MKTVLMDAEERPGSQCRESDSTGRGVGVPGGSSLRGGPSGGPGVGGPSGLLRGGSQGTSKSTAGYQPSNRYGINRELFYNAVSDMLKPGVLES
jgi:hypothetical protein